MRKRLCYWWPAAAVTLVYLAVVCALLVAGVGHTDGHLIYPLDDAYIHMSVARNLSEHLVWGVTLHAFSSSTTSPLWTAILAAAFAVGGVSERAPLALNVVAGTILIFCLFGLLRRDAGPRAAFPYLVAVVAATSLPALTLLGMEHVLHTLLTVLFVFLSAEVLAHPENGQRSRLLLLLAALLPIVRYEGVFAIALVCLFLLLQRRFRYAVTLGLAGALPLLVYGCISMSHGWYLIPNSVLLKGHLPSMASPGSILDSLGFRALRTITSEKHLLAVVLLALAGFYRALGKDARNDRQVWLAVTFLCLTLLHLQCAATGWLFRYDAYLVTLGLLAAFPAVPWLLRQVVGGLRPMTLARAPLLVSVVCLVSVVVWPLGSRSLHAPLQTQMAMRDRYLEHVQPALFVQRYYPRSTVVVNDIGAMSYFGECRVLDMYGLASMEPLRCRLRRAGYGEDDVRKWVAREGAEIAILQIEWVEVQPRIPTEWVKVAEWRVPRNVVFGDTRIGFFATDAAAAKTLASRMSAFAAVLPKDIELTMTDCLDWPGALSEPTRQPARP